MPQSVDVGSVLGGRYKVTAHVLVTAEHDTVLDGVDQVLNRPVSILVSGPDNTENLTRGAREVATGERHANLQILDLGTSDGATYLISNKSAAAELLDLVVPTEPFMEPFFTDTLGNEIFGMPRPESADGAVGYDYVYEDDSPVESGRPTAAHDPGKDSGSAAVVAESTAAAAKTGVESATLAAKTGTVPPSPSAAPARPAPPVRPASIKAPRSQQGSAASTANQAQQVQAEPAPPPAPLAKEPAKPPAKEPAAPKVTLWSDEDYGVINDEHPSESRTGTAALAAGASRAPSSFPASAREASAEFDENTEDDDDANAPRTSGRWLVGGVVSVIIVAALILAVTNLGSWFGGNQSAAPASSHSQQAPGSPSATDAGSSAVPAAPVVVPAIASVARFSADAPSLGQEFDNKLPTTFDGNPATYWQTLEFSNDTFAGLTSSINLVVTLKEAADINSVTLAQLGGSGGSFKLLTNTTPTLDGATEFGTGSFTAPSITLSAPQGTKAQYVIISFTQLPKQQTFQTYPYGVKIAEITIK